MALRTPSGANVLVYFGIQIVLDCFYSKSFPTSEVVKCFHNIYYQYFYRAQVQSLPFPVTDN